MSLRALIRIGALIVGLFLATPLLWSMAGPLPALLAACLLVLVPGYLVLAAGGAQTTRWQVRYQMEARQANERLDATLGFLAERAGYIVLEASAQGLVLEAPAAFDRYVQVQLERALPQARVTQLSNSSKQQQQSEAFYLSLDPLTGDPLGWATEDQGRQVRLYIYRGPRFTVVAQAVDGVEPPGRWMRVPVPRSAAARLWRHLPIWDELAAGTRPSHLLPTTGDGAVHSSRSRLLRLAPPDGYDGGGDRHLGETADGRPLSLSRAVPLFTVGAPPAFLVQQVAADLEEGCAVVVVSPQRRTLNLIQRHWNGSSGSQAQAKGRWLDQENSRTSAHLAVVSADEWAAEQVEPVIHLVEGFLADLGLDLHLPAVRGLVRRLVRILAASAQVTGHDLTFTDLYAISQNTQILRAFLADLAGMMDGLDPETQGDIRYLTDQLEGDAGYVQVVTVLSTIRAALSPIRAGVLHALCQPPFLNAGQALSGPGLLLVPMTNADFPEYDRFLATMLDLAFERVMSSAHDFRLALHLHDPHLYRHDNGRRWIEAARQDERLSLLVNVHDPDAYTKVQAYTSNGHRESELLFRCSEALAASLVGNWSLAYSAAELTEIPADTALVRLPGLPGLVTLKTGGDR